MSTVDAYELAYREAVRELEQQRVAVTELRGRASALIATASIAMSLLGPTIFSSMSFGWLTIGCFVLLSICVIVVVWPTADWRSGVDPRDLLAVNATDPRNRGSISGQTMALQLIAHMAEDRQANMTQVDRVTRAFRAATCLLVAHLLCAVAAAMTTA